MRKLRFKRFAALCLAAAISSTAVFPAMADPGSIPAAWSQSGGNYISSDGSVIAGALAKGIDVSFYQTNINWQAVKADGIDFAMVRVLGQNGIDEQFASHAAGAAAAGLKLGVYAFAYAQTTDAAIAEANKVIEAIMDYPVSYPVVYDVESSLLSSLTPAQLADNINAFCSTIQAAGYHPMLYSNNYWLTSKIDMSRVNYDVWVAHHSATYTWNNPAMWQASSTGTVNGINGNVDINFVFKDYSQVIPADTWRTVGGSWYYYKNYRKQTGWTDIGTNWYHMDASGKMQTGWIVDNGQDYYLRSDGTMATGWEKIGGDTYHFASAGAMDRGWTVVDGKNYYLDTTGIMYTGWLEQNHNYYYLTEDGSMATGWLPLGNTWYYLTDQGVMLTGWQDINGSRYYLNESGVMLTGWQDYNQNRYYLNASGAMVTGWNLIDNSWYYFNGEGQQLKGWQKINDAWYYLDTEGRMTTGWFTEGVNRYYFDGSGIMAIGFTDIAGVKYFFDTNGVMLTGWQMVENIPHYFDPATGAMVLGVNLTIDGKEYAFDANGVPTEIVPETTGVPETPAAPPVQ